MKILSILSRGLCAAALLLPAARAQVVVRPIAPPATALPSEEASANVSKFSFIVYGDTRGRQDGTAVQYEHSMVADAMLTQIRRLQTTAFPVRFILQSGDGVLDGSKPEQWNVSFTPIIERLTKNANIPYFLVPGNHDLGTATTHAAPTRQAGLQNFNAAMAALMPAEGKIGRAHV